MDDILTTTRTSKIYSVFAGITKEAFASTRAFNDFFYVEKRLPCETFEWFSKIILTNEKFIDFITRLLILHLESVKKNEGNDNKIESKPPYLEGNM